MDDGDRKSKQGAKQPTTSGGKFMRNTDLYDRLEAQKQEELPTILTPAEVMDILGVGKTRSIGCSILVSYLPFV